MKPRHTITAILTLFLTATASAAKPRGGTAVVDAAITRFEAAPSVSARFSVEASGAERVDGDITLCGNSFKISYEGFDVMFDGKTQWTYDHAAAEVSVTEPTPDELAGINPFIIISSLRTAFTSTPVSTSAHDTTVKFIPARRSADLESLLVTFNNLSSWPSTIKILRPDGASASIRLSDINEGRRLPASTFSWKDRPGVTVNDLR